MAVGAIPRPRGRGAYEPPQDLVPPLRAAVRLARFCLAAAAVIGSAALLLAVWVHWDLLPYVSWSRGALSGVTWWLAAIGLLGVGGAAGHLSGRRIRGQRLLPALASAGSAMMLAALPILISPVAVWSALAAAPPRWSIGVRSVEYTVQTGASVCATALFLAVVIGLLASLAAPRLRVVPPADVPNPARVRAVWLGVVTVVLGAGGAATVLVASVPDLLWTSWAVDRGGEVLAGRTRQAWLDDLRTPTTRAAAFADVVAAGTDGIPVLDALARSPALPGTERRHRAMHRFDALRHAVGVMDGWYFGLDAAPHSAVDGPERWKRVAVLGLEQIARRDPAALAVLLDVEFPSHAGTVSAAAMLRAGPVSVTMLEARLRGDQGGSAARMLATLAVHRPALREPVVRALRAAVLDPQTAWPLAMVDALADVDPTADRTLVRLLDREPRQHWQPSFRDTALGAMLRVRTLEPATIAAVERVVAVTGRRTDGQLSLPAVVLAHGRWPAPAAREDLFWALRSPRSAAHRHALRSLTTLGPSVRPYVQELGQAVAPGRLLENAEASLWAAIGGPVAVQRCQALCASGSVLTMGDAIGHWSADDPSGPRAVLTHLLQQRDPAVRASALGVAELYSIALPGAHAAAMQLSVSEFDDGRRVAARVLRHAAAADPTAIATLRRLCGDRSTQVRVAAALSLGLATEDMDGAHAVWLDALRSAPRSEAAAWYAAQAAVVGTDRRFAVAVRELLLAGGDVLGLPQRTLCLLDTDLPDPPVSRASLIGP